MFWWRKMEEAYVFNEDFGLITFEKAETLPAIQAGFARSQEHHKDTEFWREGWDKAPFLIPPSPGLKDRRKVVEIERWRIKQSRGQF